MRRRGFSHGSHAPPYRSQPFPGDGPPWGLDRSRRWQAHRSHLSKARAGKRGRGLVLVGHEYVEPRSGLRTSGMTETLDAAKAAFRDSYDKWRDWATKAGFDSGLG